MEFLGDTNNPSALDVVAFVREVVEKFPALRPAITERLIDTLSEIRAGKVFRGVLWILGEYVETEKAVGDTFAALRRVLGEVPILASEQKLLDQAGGDEEDESAKKDESAPTAAAGGGKPKVLADGTYATETAYTSTTSARLEQVKAAVKPPLRGE
jgi:coatomer subunit beta